MVRRSVIISDETNQEINEGVVLTVEKPGYMIEFPEGNFTNRLQVDIEEENIVKFLKRIKFVKPVRELTGVFGCEIR